MQKRTKGARMWCCEKPTCKCDFKANYFDIEKGRGIFIHIKENPYFLQHIFK